MDRDGLGCTRSAAHMGTRTCSYAQGDAHTNTSMATHTCIAVMNGVGKWVVSPSCPTLPAAPWVGLTYALRWTEGQALPGTAPELWLTAGQLPQWCEWRMLG